LAHAFFYCIVCVLRKIRKQAHPCPFVNPFLVITPVSWQSEKMGTKYLIGTQAYTNDMPAFCDFPVHTSHMFRKPLLACVCYRFSMIIITPSTTLKANLYKGLAEIFLRLGRRYTSACTDIEPSWESVISFG